MSLDDRCQQFHEAALGTGKSKAPARELATLRKFLHKNQDQRFSDKATARLFDTIQVYAIQKPSDEVSVDLKEGLLEDSLKMPFTVFSTKQKQKMIKWLEDLRGGSGSGSGGNGGQNTTKNSCVLSVIDLEGTTMTLMSDETGDTYEGVELDEGNDVGTAIRKAFESTDGVVSVEATIDEDSKSIKQIIRLLQDPQS